MNRNIVFVDPGAPRPKEGIEGIDWIYAQDAAWIFTYGDIPVGFEVFQSCKNIACVNPKHLFLRPKPQDPAPTTGGVGSERGGA